jgi:hypothetical protein
VNTYCFYFYNAGNNSSKLPFKDGFIVLLSTTWELYESDWVLSTKQFTISNVYNYKKDGTLCPILKLFIISILQMRESEENQLLDITFPITPCGSEWKYVKKRSDEEIIDIANVTKQDIAEVMRIVDRKTSKIPWELLGQQ